VPHPCREPRNLRWRHNLRSQCVQWTVATPVRDFNDIRLIEAQQRN
jgi:hypothetical protein